MLKWTVCQQRQAGQAGQAAVGAGSLRTPGPGPGCSGYSSSAATSPSPSPASIKMARTALGRRSCGAAIGRLAEQDGDQRTARRATRRSVARRLREHDSQDVDKENADTPETPRTRDPAAVHGVALTSLALRDVSNHGTPTSSLAAVGPGPALALAAGPAGLKTPESGKKRSRSQCRDITNFPAASRASRASLEPPRSRSSGASVASAAVTPESKRSRHRRPIRPYEDQDDDQERHEQAEQAEEQPAWPEAWPARSAQHAAVATLKYLPRQRTASSGVARIRQSRELARRTTPCSWSTGGKALGRRHRRRKSSGPATHAATPRFVRPAVGTAGDAARCAVVVPLTRETLAADRTASPAASPRTALSAQTAPRTSPALAAEPDASLDGVLGPEDVESPGDSLLRMLDRVAAEVPTASRAASPDGAVTIDYSPCPLRSTQSLLALRRRLFDSSVLEPNPRTGRLQHCEHAEKADPRPAPEPLPLTTPLIAAFNRWHRLRDTAHLVDAELESTPVPTPLHHPSVARARQGGDATPPAVSGVSPLACRLAWLRLQAQQRGVDADPTQCPFPPYGHDGRYLAVDQPQPHSSPQLCALLSGRRRRLSGHRQPEDAPPLPRRPASFRVPSTTETSTVKRSRCVRGQSGQPLAQLSDTLSLLNHGPASVSSASLTSLCSLFPGYRPASIACSSAASVASSSLSDIPALSSSPLAESSLLRRQRCVRRRRRTSLSDAAEVEACLDTLSTSLSTAASCPNIPSEVRDEGCGGAVSPPGLSSSGYSSSTTATEPLGRPATASSTASSTISSTVSSSHGLIGPRRYGLTLPTGIPSPESPAGHGAMAGMDASALVDPQFMCSTPLLPRAANAAKTTLADKLQRTRPDADGSADGSAEAVAEADASHAADRQPVAEADFDSASLLVNRGSPAACSDDTWNSHRVQKVVRTPAVRDRDELAGEDDSINENVSEYVPPSPLALVERRCRSRKGLLFASPGNGAAEAFDLDAGFPLTPSSGSSFASSASSCRSRRRSTPWRRSSREVVLPGELELNLHATADRLTVHVVRGSGLRRPGGDSCNAYVKVSLVAGATEEKTFRRTCVHRDSSQPFFDHKFSFEVHEADLEKRVLISVWHRDRPKRRSEFLGCMSFAVKHAVKKEVSGTFRLLPQAAGRTQNVPVQAAPPQQQQQQQHLEAVVEGPDATTQDLERAERAERAPAERRRAMYSSRTMESVAATNTTTTATVDRSEDSTFLRHLELEPTGPDGSVPPLPTHPTATPRPPGRTPFTSTRRLQRASNGGFGFSVAWTQPPRVERVEPGLPAEQAGIRPGDYIIFVDKHNVVTVPEEEVLQLIRSCGNQLTLEVYRRNSPNGMVPQSKSTPAVSAAAKAKPGVPSSASTSSALLSKVVTASAVAAPTPIGVAPGTTGSGLRQQPPPPPEPRPSTACSAATAATSASDLSKRRLHLPQVTFTSEAGGAQLTREEARKRAVYQLLSKEQSYSLALQFGVSRFLVPLSERRDLIGPQDHQTLFQNIQEILRITDDVLERLIHEDGEPLVNSVAQVYTAACPGMTVAYHRYCSGLKSADALLVAKTRNPEFMRFLNEPAVPRRRPDITAFLHKPLEHYREILKLLQTIHNFTRHSDDDYALLTKAVHEFQAAYRGLTTSSGIMEPEGEGRPLLTLQDVESRLVFTKCKPFALSAPGRRWIFGGDLVRVEGRSERRYWALLFTDLLLFAQVSRDRVLFISEEPLRLITVTQAAFSIKRRATEFRLMVDGSTSPSPTGLGEATKKPKKGDRRRTIVLRCPNAELKAVWQNLIQRQIIYLNTVRGGTPAGSPLDSPDPPSLSLTTADSLRDGLGGLAPRRQGQGPGQQEAAQASSRASAAVEQLIEHRCRQLGRAGGGKGSALHLARWMRGQLGGAAEGEPEPEPPAELWSVDTLNRRSEELRLTTSATIPLRPQQATHAPQAAPLTALAPLASRSEDEDSLGRTTDSQVTIRSGGSAEKVPVCRKCHKTCLATRGPHNNPWAPAPPCSSSSRETPPPTCPSPSVSATASRPSTVSPAPGGGGSSSSGGVSYGAPSGRKYEPPHLRGDMYYRKEVPRFRDQIKEEADEDKMLEEERQQADGWGPWMLMAGMSMLGGAITGDPFAPAPVPPPRDGSSSTGLDQQPPRISVVPPTPGLPRAPGMAAMTEEEEDAMWDEMIEAELQASPVIRRRKLEQMQQHHQQRLQQQHRADSGANSGRSGSQDTLDDSSSDVGEPPYRSLSSSCELHRYGTLASLPDGLAAEEALAEADEHDELADAGERGDADDDDEEDRISGLAGAGSAGGVASSLRGWTARAGVFVAEKMAILERLGDDSLAAALLDRYLRPSSNGPPGVPLGPLGPAGQPLAGEDSGTTSGGTSGEEAWGTPTSGGDMDDDLGSPLGQEFRSFPSSPPDSSSSILTAEEEAEQLMMEELLTSAALAHRLFPSSSAAARRRLEPLVEEDESVPPADTPSPSGQGSETEDSSETEEPSVLSDVPSHIGAGRPGCERHRVESLRKQQQQQLKDQQRHQTQQAGQAGFFTRLRLRRAREDLPKDAPKRGKIMAFLSRGGKSDGAGAATPSAPAEPAELSTLTTTTPAITAPLPVASAPGLTASPATTATARPIMSRLFSRDAVNDVPATLPRHMGLGADDGPHASPRHPPKQQSDRRFWKALGRRRPGGMAGVAAAQTQAAAVGASL